MPTGPRKRLVQTAIFIAVWLAGLELLTRSFLVSPSIVVPDSFVGSLYAPDSQALIETADAGYLRVHFNEFGLNDSRLSPDDRRPRVLALGDSYVEAFQVPRAQSFIGILGRDRPDLRFVNGGRSALDPVTEYLMLEKLVPVVDPADVILFVNPGDRSDMSNDGIVLRHCGPELCGYQVAPLPQPDRKGLMGLLNGRSALGTYFLRRFDEPLREQLRRFAGALPHFTAASAAIPRSGAYADRDFEPLLAFVFRRITARFPLLVVVIPDLEFEPAGMAVLPDHGNFGRLVCRAALHAHADCLDAGQGLIAAYATTGQPPRGFNFNRPGVGHLNEAGHAAVAHQIEKHLGIFAQRPAG